MDLFFILFILVIIYIFLIIIIGEIYYSFPRYRKYPIDPSSLGAKNIILEHKDGHKINGWLKESGKKEIAIIVHGHFDNAGMMFERYVPLFIKFNCDVFAIDLRNHGMSDRNLPLTYGPNESLDVKLALDWVVEKNKWEKIILFGTSMGSISALLAKNHFNHVINGLILDSPFVSINETLKLNIKKHHFPLFFIYYPLKIYLDLRYKIHGFSLQYYPDIIDQIKKASKTTKLLVTRGADDNEVSEDDFNRIRSILPEETSILVQGVGHSKTYQSNIFIEHLNQFLTSL